MDKIKDSPKPLQKKLIFTVMIGILCLIMRGAVSLFANEQGTFLLSGVICVVCLYKAWKLYHIIANINYDIIEGTCVGITSKPMHKYIKVHLMDDSGEEFSLLLEKMSHIKIGIRYRFYLKKTAPLSTGSEYFDASLSTDCFLGYEEYGRHNNFTI